MIAFGHDVFGRHQQFVNGGSQTTFQQNWFRCLAGAAQKGIILHVPGANLDNIGVLLDKVDTGVVGGLGDD